MKRLLAVSALVVATAACSGKDSPTSPSPAPAPVVVPVLSFASAPAPSFSNTFTLVDANEGQSGQVAVDLVATFSRSFHLFRGEVLYDAAVLKVLNYSEGSFMKQGDALATFSVTSSATNAASIRIDRASSAPGATGTGVVARLRFTPATGVKVGTSSLQWNDPHAYTVNFSEQLAGTAGGSITIR